MTTEGGIEVGEVGSVWASRLWRGWIAVAVAVAVAVAIARAIRVITGAN